MFVRHTRRLTLPLALLLAGTGTAAAAQDVARMDEVIEAEVASDGFMGSALVAKDGSILLDEGYGSANLSWDIPNASDTKFRIGSVTKQFTGVSILLLMEQGKLSLDDPIKKHYPDAPAAWDGITLRHLLHHTSGIPSFTGLDEFTTFKFLPMTLDEEIGKFRDLPLEFAPGEKFNYSNSGYVLLGAVIERASGQSYGEFVKANIFDPLGMENTGMDSNSAIIPRKATGYAPGKDGIVRAEYVNMDIPHGAGALYSTTGDLLKWQRGLFGGKLLKPDSLTEYLTPALSKYALGVVVDEDDGGRLYSHSGGIEGFNSWLAYDPDRKITVAVLANLNGPAANKIGKQLLTLARGEEITLAAEREEIALEASQLAEYEGTFALAPTFKITFFVDGDQLKTQATNQPVFPVFAEAKDKFFLKVVDAQLHFNRDDNGTIKSVTLLQGGQVMTGIKE